MTNKSRSGFGWTEEEENKLIEYIEKDLMTFDEAGKKLGRTGCSANGKYKEVKIKKKKQYFMLRNGETLSNKIDPKPLDFEELEEGMYCIVDQMYKGRATHFDGVNFIIHSISNGNRCKHILLKSIKSGFKACLSSNELNTGYIILKYKDQTKKPKGGMQHGQVCI